MGLGPVDTPVDRGETLHRALERRRLAGVDLDAVSDLAPFELNGEYTRAEIHARLGGSQVACLPTVDGAIVAACLLTTFSPRAPEVVLCGRGARTTAVSRRLAEQAGSLPVFLKLGASRWQYRGRFTVDRAFDSGRTFERFIEGSGRSIASVSYVVLLTPSGAG